jgi:hypothetical protein
MTKEKIIEKIEKLYQDKKSKSFVIHLVRSYSPFEKIQKVWDSKAAMRCCITNTPLCSIQDVWEITNSEGMDKKIVDHMSASFSGENPVHPIKEALKGRVLAYTGENTKTYMCLEAAQGFMTWLQNKILLDDKNISWVIKSMRTQETIKHIREKMPDENDQKIIDMLEKKTKHPQRATYSLGETLELKMLQEKLKLKEKKNDL